MSEEQYLISELAEKAGVSVRTIRYYISEGLLPSPDVRGRYSYYDESYLKRLEMIRRLKDTHMPIREIKLKLDSSTDEELEAFLALYERTTTKAMPALDYIHEVQASYPAPRSAKIRTATPKGLKSKEAAKEVFQSGLMPEELNDEPWLRYQIIDGVELHVQQRVYKADQRGFRDLIRRIKEWLRAA